LSLGQVNDVKRQGIVESIDDAAEVLHDEQHDAIPAAVKQIAGNVACAPIQADWERTLAPK
jgi:hypothetical protein